MCLEHQLRSCNEILNSQDVKGKKPRSAVVCMWMHHPIKSACRSILISSWPMSSSKHNRMCDPQETMMGDNIKQVRTSD